MISTSFVLLPFKFYTFMHYVYMSMSVAVVSRWVYNFHVSKYFIRGNSKFIFFQQKGDHKEVIIIITIIHLLQHFLYLFFPRPSSRINSHRTAKRRLDRPMLMSVRSLISRKKCLKPLINRNKSNALPLRMRLWWWDDGSWADHLWACLTFA